LAGEALNRPHLPLCPIRFCYLCHVGKSSPVFQRVEIPRGRQRKWPACAEWWAPTGYDFSLQTECGLDEAGGRADWAANCFPNWHTEMHEDGTVGWVAD
jgi:hypothetical protein